MSQSQKRKVKETSPVFPEDKKPKNMDLKDMLERMEGKLLKQMKESETRINNNTDVRLTELESKFETRLGIIDVTLAELKEENQLLREDNKHLAAQLGQIDRDRRRNNVIISGLAASTPEEAVVAINNALKTSGITPSPQIKNVRIMRLKSGQKIIGTLQSLEEKRVVMKNKRNIKAVDGNPVFIDDDLNPEDSKIQFLARQKAREWRKSGKEVKIGGGQIKMDGIWWRYDHGTGDFSRKTDPMKKGF